ncbi:MAG: outer membrane protein transport protein [Polyangiaceae bacterium]
MRRRLLSSLLLLAAPRVAGANPADTYGLGSRSTALGGAMSASARDFSACYYNPSGLALARGTDLTVGYAHVSHDLEMNGHDSQVDPAHGIVGGAVAPGSIATLPFAFGIATHLSDERLSRARSTRQDTPRWVFYDNRPQLLYLSAGLAIRPFPWLAVGGGITWLAATQGRFGIRGTAVLPSGSRTEYDSRLEHEVDADLTSVRYPQAGVTISPNRDLDLAVVYRGEAEIALAIDAELQGNIDATLLEVPARYTLTSHTTNAFIPQQVVVGGAYQITPELRASVDLTWLDWSAYESPASRSRTVLEADVPAGFELPENPKPTEVRDPGFEDRIVPRLGLEYQLEAARDLKIPLRVGYFYEHSPVPPQSGVTNFVDANRHAFSMGSGFVLEEPGEVLPGDLRFDMHAQVSLLPTRVTLKDSAADYVGDYRARGTIFNLGAAVSVGFR